MSRMVDTPYGPVPGCPDCGVIPLGGPVLCEHGVTPASVINMTFTISVESEPLYLRLLYGDQA